MHSVDMTAWWWAFLPTERALVDETFKGMAIAGCLCFCILLIATKNIIQALITLFCVSIIILSMLTIEYFLGWEIGVSESISMVLLIGFSVDYVVHLSADYVHSAHPSRHGRMQEAYEAMGVSILSGCFTTFGSGVFLFGGEMVTFRKFAVIITCTVTISFCVAMLFFGSIMHAMGPEKGCGDLDCCKKKKNYAQSPNSVTDASLGTPTPIISKKPSPPYPYQQQAMRYTS